MKKKSKEQETEELFSSKPAKKQQTPHSDQHFTDKKRKQKEADNHTVGGF